MSRRIPPSYSEIVGCSSFVMSMSLTIEHRLTHHSFSYTAKFLMTGRALQLSATSVSEVTSTGSKVAMRLCPMFVPVQSVVVRPSVVVASTCHSRMRSLYSLPSSPCLNDKIVICFMDNETCPFFFLDAWKSTVYRDCIVSGIRINTMCMCFAYKCITLV